MKKKLKRHLCSTVKKNTYDNVDDDDDYYYNDHYNIIYILFSCSEKHLGYCVEEFALIRKVTLASCSFDLVVCIKYFVVLYYFYFFVL